MATAVVARIEGLGEVLICEKTSQVGGTTATSGGTTYIPGNSLGQRRAERDTLEAIQTYLDTIVGDEASGLRDAFLKSGPEAVDYFDRNTEIRYSSMDPYPDYHAERAGGASGGRALSPLPFQARVLGKDFRKLRQPIPEFMVLGGMMVARDEIKYLLRPWRSLRASEISARRVLGYLVERLFHPRGTRLVIGNALVARMFHSCRQKGVEFALNAKLEELIAEDGQVLGAVVTFAGRRLRIRSRHGVVLATGGVAGNRQWREKLTGEQVPYSLAFDLANGEGIEAGLRAGGQLAPGRTSSFWWVPASVITWPDGKARPYPHLRDRQKPGLIAVNSAGRRFVNEAESYNTFCLAMFEASKVTPSIPAWLICDRKFLRNYGLGAINPVWQNVRFYEKVGYVTSAPTIAELADKIGVDGIALAEEVVKNNKAAETGVDEAFGRGSFPLDQLNGDPDHGGPNPCIGKIETPPFYACAIYPAPIGASAGLRTDADAQVLDAHGQVIQGLYAVGNDMHSLMEGAYPGPGATLGPGLVFAYRAAMHAAGNARQRSSREDRRVVATAV